MASDRIRAVAAEIVVTSLILGSIAVIMTGCAAQVAREVCEQERYADATYAARAGLTIMGMLPSANLREPMINGEVDTDKLPPGGRPRVISITGGAVAVGVIEPAEAPWALDWFSLEGEDRAWPHPPHGGGPFLPKPLGTVIILHGWNESISDAAGWAAAAINMGFRVVLVDLAIYTPDRVERSTFGPEEVRLVQDVVTTLRRDGTIQGPVALWGYSMGAAVALGVAATDPRFAAVIAVGPYARLRDALEAKRDLLPWYRRWWISTDDVNAAISARTGRQPEDEPIALAPHIVTPVLLVAGTNDRLAPPCAVGEIAARVQHADLMVVPGAHMELPWAALQPSAEWLVTHALGRQLLPPFRFDGPGCSVPALVDFCGPGSFIAACFPGDEPVTWVLDLAVPMSWWFHDVRLDLGPIIAGGAQASCDGIPLVLGGAVNNPSGIRCTLPGWLAVGSCSIRLTLAGGDPYRRVIGRLLGRGIAHVDVNDGPMRDRGQSNTGW